MELCISKPRLPDPSQRRRRDDAPESAVDAETLIIGHDEEDVGRTLGRHHARRPPSCRILCALVDHATEGRRRWRELIALERGRLTGRTQYTGNLLRRGWRDRQRDSKQTDREQAHRLWCAPHPL